MFFVSDGTGITAQMLGHSLLTQFEGVEFNQVTLPFVDTRREGRGVPGAHRGRARQRPADRLLHAGQPGRARGGAARRTRCSSTSSRPSSIRSRRAWASSRAIRSGARTAPWTRRSTSSASRRSTSRMAHDDGASHRELGQADVILIGVSRSGKTPTSLYLALQFGVKAANYPLIPEDFAAHEAARGAARRRRPSSTASPSPPSGCTRSARSAGPTAATPTSTTAASRSTRPRT